MLAEYSRIFLNCLLIHSVHTTQREEPSIRMALLFGILTPASAQFEPDKHAPNQSGWLGACIFSAKNAYFFFALIAACAAADITRKSVGQPSTISNDLIQQVSYRSLSSLRQNICSLIVRIFSREAFCSASSAVML